MSENTKALEAYGPVEWERCDILANHVLRDKDSADFRKSNYRWATHMWREPTPDAVMYAVAYLTLRAQLAEAKEQLAALQYSLGKLVDAVDQDYISLDEGAYRAMIDARSTLIATRAQPNNEVANNGQQPQGLNTKE